ncbi:MAG: CPBP family glutamic-type intramembrane protease [Planctomycetota bacterium]|jgi:hypothetical protein
MARRKPVGSSGPPDEPEAAYWSASRRPLQMLLFLLPLIVAYEAGLAWVLRTDSGVVTNKAHESLLRFFEVMGVNAAGGLFLGGIVIIVVLLVWHLLNRDPWRLDWATAGFMAVESVLLTLPLLAVGLLVQRGLPAAAAGATPDLAQLDLWSRMAISVGAGLYEELLFRMLLIAVVHTLLVDLFKLDDGIGTVAAIGVSAISFTVYHPLGGATGELSMSRLVFYLLAGIYFGVVYVLRGFGIVVAVHAFYDVLAVAWMGASG